MLKTWLKLTFWNWQTWIEFWVTGNYFVLYIPKKKKRYAYLLTRVILRITMKHTNNGKISSAEGTSIFWYPEVSMDSFKLIMHYEFWLFHMKWAIQTYICYIWTKFFINFFTLRTASETLSKLFSLITLHIDILNFVF